MQVTVIIPTFNESENIQIITKEVHSFLEGRYDHEILVVDDDSPDKTWKVAGALDKKYKVKVIRRREDKGLSQSVLEGMKEAKGDICLVMDADLSHPPALVPKIIDAVLKGGNDIAIGSRLVKGGGVEDWPWYRRLVSFGARILARPITPVRDTMSGFFAIRKDKIIFNQIQPIGYKILLETLIKCKPVRAKEIPFTFRNREFGESKLGFSIYIDYLLHLARLYRHVIFSSKPKHAQNHFLDEGHYDRAIKGKWTIQKFWHMTKFKKVRSLIENPSSKKIMELGCGPGTFLSMLKPNYTSATGIDNDPNQMAYAKKHYATQKLTFKMGDITKPLPIENQDIIIISEVIEHIPLKESEKMLKQAKASLKKGGSIILTTPNYRSFWPIIEFVWNKMNPVNYEELHVNKYNMKKLTSQLKKHGFKIDRKGTFLIASPFLFFLPLQWRTRIQKSESAVLPGLGSLLYVKAIRK